MNLFDEPFQYNWYILKTEILDGIKDTDYGDENRPPFSVYRGT